MLRVEDLAPSCLLAWGIRDCNEGVWALESCRLRNSHTCYGALGLGSISVHWTLVQGRISPDSGRSGGGRLELRQFLFMVDTFGCRMAKQAVGSKVLGRSFWGFGFRKVGEEVYAIPTPHQPCTLKTHDPIDPKRNRINPDPKAPQP